MKTMVRNTAKSLITDRTYITKTNEYTLCIYCIQNHTVYAKTYATTVFQPHPCWEVSTSLELFQEARQENGTEKQDG